MKEQAIIHELEAVLELNFDYVKKHSYRGFDPQVYWYLPFTRRAKANPTFINKVFRKIEVKVLAYFPRLLLPYLKLLKMNGYELVPYGLGVFIQAYLNCYDYFGDEKYLIEAQRVADQLENLLVSLPNGLGVPNSKKDKSIQFFNQTTSNDTVYLPSGAEVFEGFFRLYLSTSEERYLVIAKKIGTSFFKDHTVKRLTNERVALDYSSINDGTHILNANALAAACLCELHKYDFLSNDNEALSVVAGIDKYLAFYLKNYEYLPYAGEEDMKSNKNWKTCDAYHTGFTLRGCLTIAQVRIGDEAQIFERMKKMLMDFSDERERILTVIGQTSKPQDVHAVAEYIHIFALCYPYLDEEQRSHFMRICMNNIRSFSHDGTYFYTVKGRRKNALYMPRWAQAPMMNAISRLLLAIRQTSPVPLK